MAHQISFTPKPADPKLELERRLAAAPSEHAEALLAALDLLEEAHRQGVLDVLHGAIGAKDALIGELAKHAAEPTNIHAMRNLLAFGKILATLNPESIEKLSNEISAAAGFHIAEKQPPTLWQLFQRVRQPEARRGLSLLTSLLAVLGRAVD